MAEANTNQSAAARTSKSQLESADDKVKVSAWLLELEAAHKREKDWRAAGQKCVDLYEAAGNYPKTHPYNILFSNTETLSPALYNSPPRAVVKPRFVSKDNALPRLAALTGQRLLQFFVDSNNPEYPDLDEVVKQTVTEALVPGRGIPRVKYEATFEKEETSDVGEDGKPIIRETVSYEETCVEVVPWDRFSHGYAKHWEQVPWVSFEHQMSLDEASESFGKDVAATLAFEDHEGSRNSEREDKNIFSRRSADSSGASLAQVFEIWYKPTRQVFFISPSSPEKVLKVVEDPLKLQGFFPNPKPLQFVRKVSGILPQTLYAMYEQQAQELNDITVRITKIVRALKVRGYYNSTVEGLKNLLEQDDNTMLPITNAGQLQLQGVKLDDAIWLFPIERLVAVLQQLVLQRQQVKGVIFEITGIADIMRGSSQASETLGAQEIKNQWGTLRLKRMQKEVARFVRDIMRLAVEVMVTQYSVETVRAMTGLPFPTRKEKEAAQLQMQQMQATIPPGTPPGQIPPQMQQLMATAQAPDLDTVLELLRDDTLRNFAVDIENNSTVDAEATEDKQDMAELMNALAQFLNGVTPLVESGAMPFDAAKVIMLNLLRRFRMGGDIEEAIMAMQPPSQGGEGEKKQLEQMQQALEKQQQELEKQQQDIQKREQELEAERREFEQSQKFALKEIQQAQAFASKSIQQEREFAARQLQMDQQAAERELQDKVKAATADHERNVQTRELQSQAGELQRREAESAAKAVEAPPPAPVAPQQPLVLNITIDGKTGAVKRSVKVQRDAEGNLIGADVSDDSAPQPQAM